MSDSLPQSVIILYQTEDGRTRIWDEGELAPGATIRSFRIVRTESRREVARDIATCKDYLQVPCPSHGGTMS